MSAGDPVLPPQGESYGGNGTRSVCPGRITTGGPPSAGRTGTGTNGSLQTGRLVGSPFSPSKPVSSSGGPGPAGDTNDSAVTHTTPSTTRGKGPDAVWMVGPESMSTA